MFQLFADLERLRVEIADRESDMRRNVAESEEADKKKADREKEFKKNFEATRQKRTDVRTHPVLIQASWLLREKPLIRPFWSGGWAYLEITHHHRLDIMSDLERITQSP